jgi:signal transduction histidine kinase
MQVIGQCEEQLKDKDLQLDVKASPNLLPVMGNARRLRQVLSNLLSNAIKYTPSGKQISVSVGLVQNEILVSIQDAGIGIPSADQPHIFEKFYRVDRPEMAAIKGTGLGLAITRSIVEKLGGHIWVESEMNVGSTFTFTVPVMKDGFD